MNYLILATDNSNFVNLGNINLLFSFQNYLNSPELKTYIVFPQKLTKSEVSQNFECVKNNNIEFISGETSDIDPYFLQISISQIFNLMSLEDKAIYLDYDHLVINPRFLKNIDNKYGITVSSQTSKMSIMNSVLNFEHYYNSSIICGRDQALRKLAQYWKNAYNDIIEYTNFRNRTEIALTKALKKACIEVNICQSSFQSNFENWSPKYQIFHYGGESELSKKMKNILIDFSNYQPLSTITIKSINQLNAELKSLLKNN